MDAKDLTCKILSTLMELDPHTEIAKLVAEFSNRSDAGDSKAFWTDDDLIGRINIAIEEVRQFELANKGKIISQATNLANSL